MGLFFIFVVVPTVIAKGKPNGGGDAPIVVDPGTAEVDGDLSEWSFSECNLSLPLHWAGQKNKEILAEVLLAEWRRHYVQS